MAVVTPTLNNGAAVPTGYNLEAIKVGYTVTASAADTFNVCAVKKGWRIVDIRVDFEGTASRTLRLGDGGSATRYLSAVSTASSGELNVAARAFTTNVV